MSIRGEHTGEVPILRMNCQDRGRVVMRDLQYVNVDERTLDAYRLEPGDILFNRTNSFELVGRSALYELDALAVFASYLVRLKVDREKVDPKYLTFILNSPKVQRALRGMATRGVSQSNISASKLKELEIDLPALSIQTAIARTLGQIQDSQDAQAAIIQRLGELFDATLTEMMRPK
ncbi:MAG: restriction endonuclease subunit S [Thermoanaerobaculia bacterium]